MTTVQEVFDVAFELRINLEIPFNPKWSNGTGYFDYAVYGEDAPVVPFGTMAKSESASGRRLIIIGTRLGNLVVFERTTLPGAVPVFTYNSTTVFKEGGWIKDEVISKDEMELIVGVGPYPNLGKRIDNIFQSMKKAK